MTQRYRPLPANKITIETLEIIIFGLHGFPQIHRRQLTEFTVYTLLFILFASNVVHVAVENCIYFLDMAVVIYVVCAEILLPAAIL